MEHRGDRLPAVGHNLTAGFLYRLLNLLFPLLSLAAPLLLRLRLEIQIGGAVGIIVADVCVRMDVITAGDAPGLGEGARRGRLCLERLRGEGGGHLRRSDPCDIGFEIHLAHGSADGNCNLDRRFRRTFLLFRYIR